MTKMKKFWYIAILAMLILSFSVLAQKRTSISLSSDVRISFVSQDPDPAEPGQYVDVRFKIENNGSEQAEDFVFELLPEFPFSLDPGVDAVEKLGALHSRQLGETAVIVKYKVRIDNNAVQGDNELKYRYKFDNNEWIEVDLTSIDVQTHDAILAVESVLVNRKAIEPGSSNVVKIVLSNRADSVLKDIKINLDLGDVPFIPLGSTNEKSIYQIEEKENYELSFNLLANPEAESGAYQIPMKIEYSDELGNGYTKNSTIGLVINARPDLSVTLDETDIFEAGKSGEVVVKIVNKGVTDIKFMNIKLEPGEDYKILSNGEVYLGNIDSDDFETSDFDLFVEKTKKDQVMLPIILEYKDANNNNYIDSLELRLDLYSSSEAKKFGLREGNGFGKIIVVIIVLAVGFFLYRRYRKNKRRA
ncbi:hypothetical protein CMO83_01225 [Candidatus Woesearchaeota archaeon]|nr:hypothetical protein [Candidatus Woesearchaeota archaeon]